MTDTNARVPPHVPRVKLRSNGLEVSVQGLGCLGMSPFYGLMKLESDMIALIRHAISSGVTFLDTSDVYGPFTTEILLIKVSHAAISFCVYEELRKIAINKKARREDRSHRW